MKDIAILPKGDKGRVFHSTLLAHVLADSMWPGGRGDSVRPVWATFCGTDTELRPFVANLTLGRKATCKGSGSYRRGDVVEFLKSSAYATSWQRHPEGCLVTIFLPDLFRLDPGMVDPTGIRFVMLPSAPYLTAAQLPVEKIVEHGRKFLVIEGPHEWRETPPMLPLSEEVLRALAPQAYLFVGMLDRRTRAPIVADGRFYLQLLIACLRDGAASWPSGDRYGGSAKFGELKNVIEADGVEDIGYAKPIAFEGSHEAFEALLAEETTRFFELTKGI